MQNNLEEMKQEVAAFLMSASPRQLTEFVDHMEKHWRTFEILPAAKRITFSEILDTLNASVFHLNKGGKGYGTQLHIDENEVTLVVSRKDSQNLEATYTRLYDQHKDELLRMIDSSRRSHAVLVKVGVR